MGVNRVDYGDETIIDITDTTADEENVLEGFSFYGADGEKKTGSVVTRKVTDIEENSMDDYLSEAQVGEIIITEKDGGGEDANLEKVITDNWNGNGYNLIPYPYTQKDGYSSNGITWNVNKDGSIVANGTATANSQFIVSPTATLGGILCKGRVRLSAFPFEGSASSFRINGNLIKDKTIIKSWGNTTNDITIDIDNEYDGITIIIVIYKGYTANNLTFYPMLTIVNSDGTYPTEYQRYSSGNVELTDNINDIEDKVDINSYAENGIHNLLKNTATSQTINGISYTVNNDNSVVANGTASRWAGLVLYRGIIKSGNYLLSGCTNGDDNEFIKVTDYPYTRDIAYNRNEDTAINLSVDTNVEITLFIKKSVSNKTYYPMLRVATDTDTTYRPYIKSNSELTQYTNQLSNPNLLYNPFFTVNQRGFTESEIGTTQTYTVDKWKSWRSKVKVETDGVSIAWNGKDGTTGIFANFIENDKLAGKTFTVSVYFDNQLHTFTTKMPSKGVNSFKTTNIGNKKIVWGLEHVSTSIYPYVVFICHSTEYTKIKAVKLELGSISTLANDIAPDYGTELLKCISSKTDSTDTYANNNYADFIGYVKDYEVLTNCDNATENGKTYLANAATANKPGTLGHWGMITAMKYTTQYVIQLWIDLNVTDAKNPRMCYRCKLGSTWGSWFLLQGTKL